MAKKSVPRLKSIPSIFKLKITLQHTTPSVWRRILVPSDFRLDDLHQVIQYAMGWQNSHLYDFEIGGTRFSEPSEFEDELPAKPVRTKLTEGLKGLQKFSYNYDFGDGWRHEIVIEETMLQEEFMQYPLCIAGENACPPEDCGGPPGFEELKNKIADPEDEDHLETLSWLGGFFDPKAFDPNRINRDLLWQHEWGAKTTRGDIRDPLRMRQ